MTNSLHLWAIGYDDMGRANQVREEITSLGWVKHGLILVVVVRQPAGLFTVDRGSFPAAHSVLGFTAVGLLAGLVLGAPLAGAAVGAVIGGAGTAGAAAAVGIGEDFIREVKGMMTPGTSALFEDQRGCGAARLIQSTLAVAPAQNEPTSGGSR